MKTRMHNLFVIAAMLLVWMPIEAQTVSTSYAFSQGTGAYVPISGGLTLGDETTDDQRFVDPSFLLGTTTVNSGPGFAIGFSFWYNGRAYDRFAVNANGWISLGQSNLSPSVDLGGNAYNPLAVHTVTPAQLRSRIAVFANDLQAQVGASIKYETLGIAPNRVLLVQWSGYKKEGIVGVGDNYNFQIKLYEESNLIELIYGPITNNATSGTYAYQVGLGGESSSDFNNRSTTTNWWSTTAGLSSNSYCFVSNAHQPGTGLTFTYTPVSNCLNPGILVNSVTSGGATIHHLASLGSNTDFEYVISTSNTTPVGSGISATGNTAVVTGLAPGTVHYAFVRTDCGSSTYSDWSYAYSFNTACISSMAGSYTINAALPTAGNNFQSFSELANELSICGISGPLTINVAAGSGPYTEQFLLGVITGSSSTNTITINGNGETLEFLSTNSNERATVKLDGTDYVTINNLNIKALGLDASTDNYGFGIQLINNADYNTIESCTIEVDPLATSSGFGGIIGSSQANNAGARYLTIINCTVIGGNFGININGATDPNTSVFNTIINTEVKNWHTIGISLFNCEDNLIEGNDIHRTTRAGTLTTFHGIYLSGRVSRTNVLKNRIHNSADLNPTSTTAQYGIICNGASTDGAADVITIANNAIYNLNSSGTTVYGISLQSSTDNVRIWHNTIVLDKQTGTSVNVAGIHTAVQCVNTEIKNNNIYLDHNSTSTTLNAGVVYSSTSLSAGNPISNNNNVFIGSNSTNGTWGRRGSTQYATLSAWQTATLLDANSRSLDPQFTNPVIGEYKPTTAALNNRGIPVAGISTDISGATRHLTLPDVGAWEFTPTGCIVPDNLIATSPFSIATLNWDEFGTATEWEVEYGLPGFTPGSGTVITGITSKPINTPTLSPSTTYEFYVRAICGSLSNSPWAGPHSFTTGCAAGLNGNYTINSALPTGGSNFQSFTALAAALNGCGVQGLTIVEVVVGSGPYTEQFKVEEVIGSSATNTVTILGNGEVLQYLSTNTADRATMLLNGTDYLTLNNLTIKAQGSTTTQYGYAVQLLTSADYITFTNCRIEATTLSTANRFYAVYGYFNSFSVANYLSITNCEIVGGYSGIYLYAAYFDNYNNQAPTISDNIIRDFYFQGLLLSSTPNAIVSNNDITRSNRSSISNFEGINISGGQEGTEISYNRIHNNTGASQSGSGYSYPIMIRTNGTAANPILVYNNALYNNRGATAAGGINAEGSYIYIYSNSISINNTTSSTSAIVSGIRVAGLNSTLGSNIILKNNLIYINHNSTNTSYRGLWFWLDPFTSIISNNNNVFIANQNANRHYAQDVNNTYNTLASWQAAYSSFYDQNSQNIDPLFADLATGDLKPSTLGLDNLGTPIPIVSIDILGNVRNATTPDIGAWEFGALLATWYLDADNDGWYVQTQQASNSPGTGWKSTPPSGGSGDCDDSNVSIWQNGQFYIDADGDGYVPSFSKQNVCYGNSIPAGYSLTQNGFDCFDNDPNSFATSTWYQDEDGDGHYFQVRSACTSPGVGWNSTGGISGDCNDNDNSIWQTGSFWIDVDGDGYTLASIPSLICYGATLPLGIISSSLGQDCNDADVSVWQTGQFFVDADGDGFSPNPTASTICYGATLPAGLIATSLGLDCNDADVSVWQTGQYFVDVDGDGYSPNPSASTVCYGATLPAGLIEISSGLDCNDADGSVWQTGQFFVDVDGDGYSPNPSASTVCYGATLPAGLIAASQGFDCDDNNLLINAGAQHIEFSGGANFISSIINQQQGTSYTNFQFEATYFDANGALPPPTYPRVYLDYEGNGVYNNANDRAIIMTPFDAGDVNTADGKRYIGTINTLPNGTNWQTSVQVTAGSCLTQIGPFNYPDVLVMPDLQIFANNITFSSANPAVSSPLTVSAVITNVSDYAAQNFVVHLVNEYDTSIVYPDIVVSNLAAHTSTTVSWNITTPAVPAWCPMRVSLDHTNVIVESNELDNNAVRPFTNGNFSVPGTIAIAGSVVPPVSFSSVGNVLSLAGSASYSGIAVNMANLSVAGAEVNFTIVETGANFIGYTDAQGNFNLPFTAPLGAGTYSITGYITDFTLTGFLPNGISLIILPVCKPDLISTLSVSSNLIIEGQSVTASVDVTNAGCATAPASVLTFSQSGGNPTLTNVNVPQLAPGATFSASLGSITFAAPGSYGICSTADGDFAIEESNEYNNVSCQSISVLPALGEIAVQHGPSPVQFNCTGTVPIYVEVANTGGAATGNFNCLMHVKQGLTIVQTFNVPVSSIASQSYTAFSVNFNVPSNGSYTVEIICDNTNVVTEVNENNNTSEFAVDILLCQPDLVVGDCEFVDATSANTSYTGTMDLNATIFNQGNAVATGPINVKFELSNGTSYTTQILGNLAPGASALATVNVPAFISTSTTLTVIADYTNSIAELQEFNNQSVAKRTSWEFYPVANFYPCGTNFWDVQYLANQAIYLSAAYRADELYDADTLDIKFEVSGPGIVGTINLGNAQAYNVEQSCGTCPRVAVLPNNFVFGQVGTYTFTMTVDPDNKYAETNEGNNVMVVTVVVTDLPDMRTLSQFINPSALNPLAGQNVTFAVTYDNIGASNITDQMKFNLLVDNVLIESAYPVNGLVTNDNATYNFSIPWSSNIPGAHIIRAIIDSDDDVLEQTNANNEATRAIVVGDAANLFFDLLTSPTLNPNLNDPMQIVATIENGGALVSTADVKFYYVDDFLNEVLIDTRNVTVAGNDNTTITVPWTVLDNKTTIIGRIVNSTALEFNYDDNEASFAIGAMDLLLQANEACDPGNLGSITTTVSGGTPPYNYTWSNGSGSSTLVDVAGTYNLVVTDNTGQSVSGSATIDECTVNCVPVATSFTQIACNSYVWNGVLYTTSGQHVQTLTTVLGCDSVVTLNLTLGGSNSSTVSCSISSVPSNSVFTGGSAKNLYLGYGAQSTTLNVSSTGGSSWTYSWSGNTALLSNTNTKNPVFTPVMGGSYTFTVTTTNEFGCSSTCDITIDVVDARCGKSNNPKVIVCHNGHEICISANAVPAHLSNHSGDIIGPCPPAKATPIVNNQDELEIVTYPSPFTDAFHVELITTSASNYSIAIFDINGKLLEKHENLQMADNPDFGRDLPQGFYMIEVMQDGVRKIAKLSKVY